MPGQSQPMIARFWDQLGPATIATLTDEQKIAIGRALSAVASNPPLPLDIRLSFGWFFIAILGGRETRSGDRLAQERKVHPIFRLVNVVVLMVLWGALAFATYHISLWLLDLYTGWHTAA